MKAQVEHHANHVADQLASQIRSEVRSALAEVKGAEERLVKETGRTTATLEQKFTDTLIAHTAHRDENRKEKVVKDSSSDSSSSEEDEKGEIRKKKKSYSHIVGLDVFILNE